MATAFKYSWPWLLTCLWLVLDQASKWLVVARIPPREAVPVVPGFLDLVHVHNYGVAFGLLNSAPGWQVPVFAAVSLVVMGVIGVWLYRLGPTMPLMRLALGLLLGGAAGNLLDRVRLGYVVDFVDVHWRDVYHYPAFNVADAGITAAALLLAWLLIREERAAA